MRTIISLIIINGLFVSTALAQMNVPQNSLLYPKQASRYEAISEVKEQIAILLDENAKLESQYRSLKEDYSSLQHEVDLYRKDLGVNTPEKMRIRNFVKKPAFTVQAERGDVQSLQNTLMLKKSKNIYLRGELLDLEEQEKLWELSLADLKFERRQLMLNLKKNQYDRRSDYFEADDVFDDLQTQVKRSLEQERELKSKVKEMQDAVENMPVYMPKIKNEIIELEIKIDELSKLKTIKAKENALLKDKQEYELKKYTNPVLQKENERDEISALVDQLQQQYDELDESVAQTLELNMKKRDLYKQVIALDKENLALREKISKIQAEIDTFK